MPNELAPLLSDRLRLLLRARGLPRALVVRRIIALCLVLLALVLAVRQTGHAAESTRPVVVAASDLRSGAALHGGALRLRELPAEAVPGGAYARPATLRGRVLVSAARAGEPITDARLVGPTNTALTVAGPQVRAVGVRLADPGVADLLRPGAHVDVVGGTPTAQEAQPGWAAPGGEVLASDATVITVREVATDDGQRAPIVVLALGSDAARRVAALSLHEPVTVTLRQT